MHDNRTLENKTQIYWGLSRIWEGQNHNKVSTEMAISMINDTVTWLNPHRPIAKRLNQLQQAIIRGCDQVVTQPQKSA